jgi:hypothetical protein
MSTIYVLFVPLAVMVAVVVGVIVFHAAAHRVMYSGVWIALLAVGAEGQSLLGDDVRPALLAGVIVSAGGLVGCLAGSGVARLYGR